MSDSVAFLLTLVLLITVGWAWPVLAEVRGLLIAKLRARRERIEHRERVS